MAVPASTYQRTNITHELESIRDAVEMVSPETTPFYSNAPKVNVENTKHEWIIDALAAADTSNAFVDGAEFAPSSITPTIKLDNQCQIQREDFLITRRARLLNKAGQRDELARQIAKHGTELRITVEATLLHNQAKVADDGSSAPKLAGLPTWVPNITGGNAHGDYGAGGSGNTSFTAGTAASVGEDVKTDGTVRAATESELLTLVESIVLDSRVMPNVLMLDVRSKRNFSNYMFSSSARIATQYQQQGANPRGGVTVVGAVDKYVTDFTSIDVVPNVHMPLTLQADGYDWFLYNSEYIECAMFDPFSTDALGQRGDTFDRIIIVDHTLVVRNPYTLASLADVDHTAAMTA